MTKPRPGDDTTGGPVVAVVTRHAREPRPTWKTPARTVTLVGRP
ncbi:MAG: hypothetical protein ABWY11_02460 [Umezawaea sp.]